MFEIFRSKDKIVKNLHQIGSGVFGKVYIADLADEDLKKKWKTDKIAIKEPFQNIDEEKLKKEIDFYKLVRDSNASNKELNIVKFYDYASINGKIVILMEYIPDGNLRDLLGFQKDRKKLDIELARNLMYGIFKGVRYIHSKKIFHRDLKPDNVLIKKQIVDGQEILIPKIADFGHSRVLAVNEKAASRWGSSPYMAPELLMNNESDLRSDIWALGVICYEMLAGKLPFDKNDIHFDESAMVFYVERYVAHEPHIPLKNINPAVPEPLSCFIDKCLAINVSDRFQSMRELIKEYNKVWQIVELKQFQNDPGYSRKRLEKKIERFIKKYPQDSTGYLMLGHIYMKAHDWINALNITETGRKNCPRCAELLFRGGFIKEKLGEKDDSLWYYEKALENNLEHVDIKLAKVAEKKCADMKKDLI